MIPSIALFIALSTYLTPSPQHAEGLIVLYGSDRLTRINAEYHHYSLEGMRDHCALSLISPADLGKLVWVALPDGSWYGPCLAVDVAARPDFYHIVYENKEIAEVGRTLAKLLQFKHGSSAWGQIYIGHCPPHSSSVARLYRPPLAFDDKIRYRPWNKQWRPISCTPQKRY